jgi:ribonuclease P protein component
MLPREHRLKKETDIKTLFKKGKGLFDSVVGAKYKKTDQEVPRFVVVVGTKVHKRAYRRNKIRRRIRAILKKNLSKVSPGYDIAIIARPEATTATYKEIEASVLSVLKKAHLYEPEE